MRCHILKIRKVRYKNQETFPRLKNLESIKLGDRTCVFVFPEKGEGKKLLSNNGYEL
jgi:hypothetical protein